MSDVAPVQAPLFAEAGVTATMAANDGENGSNAKPLLHFGERLAAERQRLNLSVGDMAERLRLQSRQVVALERAQFDMLPALTFVRGYVRNYAKAVGLEAEPLLADLSARVAPAAAPISSEALVPTAASLPFSTRDVLSRRVTLALVLGLLLLFAAVGLWTTRTPSPVVVAPPAQHQVAEPKGEPLAAAGNEPSAPITSEAAKPVEDPASVEAAPVAPVKPAEALPPAPTRASVAALLLTFRERSWVEITQVDGRVLLSQINEPGTEQQIIGQPPFRVVIGNADGVLLAWRGRLVDLTAQTSIDNVARVTLE